MRDNRLQIASDYPERSGRAANATGTDRPEEKPPTKKPAPEGTGFEKHGVTRRLRGVVALAAVVVFDADGADGAAFGRFDDLIGEAEVGSAHDDHFLGDFEHF